MSFRILRVNELIKEEVGKILQQETSFSNALVTVTSTQTTQDLRETKVFISVFPFNKAERVMIVLQKTKGQIQKRLNKKLYMKPLPKIKFVLDQSQEKMKQVEDLLKGNDENNDEKR